MNLEWWRHLERFKRAELTAAQQNWVKSKEKTAIGRLLEEDKMQEFRDTKRKWMEEADGAGPRRPRRRSRTGSTLVG